jgi:TrmH family RNA methyltransferase
MNTEKEGAQNSRSSTGSPVAPLLQRVRVVLARTQHPGNAGSAARALKTMGLNDLALVSLGRPLDYEAMALAAGASDVLTAALNHETLPEALAGCSWVIGVTARHRDLSVPFSTLRDCTRRLAAEQGGRIAFVFGAERTGLTNEELALCNEAVTIPANPEYGSLNLAAAVQVVAYELRLAAEVDPVTVEGEAHLPSDHATMEGFYAHLERVLIDLGFLDPAMPRHLMRRLRRLFSRAAPNDNETNILRGILTAVDKVIRKSSAK